MSESEKPFYTIKKEWVWLTDEEICGLFYALLKSPTEQDLVVAKLIQAMVMEKNT